MPVLYIYRLIRPMNRIRHNRSLTLAISQVLLEEIIVTLHEPLKQIAVAKLKYISFSVLPARYPPGGLSVNILQLFKLN